MAAALLLLFLFLLLHSPLLSSGVTPVVAPMSDSFALLLLKESFTNTSSLSSWSTNTTPCNPNSPWAGVVCFHGIVTGLHLIRMGLSGKIDVGALSHFTALRSLSFVGNSFSGPIPPLPRLHALKSLYLSHNRFSGDIPENFFSGMDHLKKLWLSGNAFTGHIPSSLSNASHLMELHLEDNRFSGSIPTIRPPSLKSFNVSNNDLEGPIPESFEKFDASSFAGNAGLCGVQLDGKPCTTPVAAPSQMGKMNTWKMVLVCVMLVMLLAAMVVLVMSAKKRQEKAEFDSYEFDSGEIEAGEIPPHSSQHKRFGSSNKRSGSSHKKNDSSHKSRSGSSKAGGGGDGGGCGLVGELVVVNEEKGVFGLPDLMKAAAEVLGNGGLGSAYKAVMGNGTAVVVKRMRDMNKVGKEGFEAEMGRLGRLRHRNVLTPLAYHYRMEEKLLVYEYVPKGSLLYILHGDRGPNHAALDWPTRLKIVRGIARGMVYLHAELASLDVPHGNLKSGNVLLGSDFEPLIADYGFIPLVKPSQASQAMFAYKSPESLQHRHVSAKSDVYCLGIIILEILTGKFPSQYLNNTKGGTDVVQWGESAISEKREAELLDLDISSAKSSLADMERLFRLGVACAESNPDKRLDMREAAARIEAIGAEGTAGSAPSEPSESSHVSYVREGYGGDQLSTRRLGSIGERSSRRNGDTDSFAFA